MSDERDPPIQEQEYLGGVTVVNIGDVRVARGLTRRAHSSCPHINMIYDLHERRIWCKDCEHDVEPFDAFLRLVEPYDRGIKDIKRQRTELNEAMAFQARLIATKKIEEAWRSHKMVPACPHCSNGLFPEDFKSGIGMVGKEYARARLGKRRALPAEEEGK